MGPDNPYRVELDHTAEMMCHVDAKPATESVRWEYAGRFIDTNYRHIIPQVKCLAFSPFNVESNTLQSMCSDSYNERSFCYTIVLYI